MVQGYKMPKKSKEPIKRETISRVGLEILLFSERDSIIYNTDYIKL